MKRFFITLSFTLLPLVVILLLAFSSQEKMVGFSGNLMSGVDFRNFAGNFICASANTFFNSQFGNFICGDTSVTLSPTPAPSLGWTPMDIPTLELWVQSAYLQHLYQEPDATSSTLTVVTSSGQYVGTVYDSSINAHELSANSAIRRPRIYASATSSVPSYFSFSTSTAGGAAPTNLQVRNSTAALRGPYTGASTTIMFKVGFNTNSTTSFTTILDSGGSSSAQTGVSILRTTANRIQILVSKAVSGQPVFNYTSATPILVSHGIVPVVIRFSTTTNNITIGNNAMETFSRSNPPTSTPSAVSNGDIFIGSLIGGTTGNANMNLQDLVIASDYLSTSTIDTWIAYTPSSTTSTSLLVATSTSAGDFNFLNAWYRFNTTTAMWADTARTIVATSTIRRLDHWLDSSLAKLSRTLSSASVAASPTFISTATGTDFDGSNDNFSFPISSMRGAPKTVFIAVRNEDTMLGSHVLQGTNYTVITGQNYVGNAASPCNAPYYTVHPSSGATVETCLQTTGYGIMEIVRDGSDFTQLHNGTNSSTSSSAFEWSWSNMGQEAIVGWFLDGQVCEMRSYDVVLSASQRATVRNQIAANCGITL